MIVLGAFFKEEDEKQLILDTCGKISNAGNSFQWKVIKGLCEESDESLVLINVLPIGTWPRYYNKVLLRDKAWNYKDNQCFEIGAINLPVIKQLTRMLKVKKIIKEKCNESEILMFTAYLPFLWAVKHLDSTRNVTAVITDIPEYYDLHKVSPIRSLLRKMHNRLVYRSMKRVDRFILLTEHMRVPLRVGNRPWMLMEGISESSEHKVIFNDKFSMLYSGRLNRKYGLPELISAFESIDDDDMELWICGAGELETKVRELSNRDNRIKFYGFVTHEQAMELQSKASILVNPRFNNEAYTKYSFPSKTMEYMATGKPVLMFRLDGIPSDYDQYLMYIPHESVESIRDTIIEIKNTPKEILAEFGEKGKSFVDNNKNKNIQAKRIVDFIKETKREQ